MIVVRDLEGEEYPLIAEAQHKSELNGTEDIQLKIHPKLNQSIFNISEDTRQGNILDTTSLFEDSYIASHGGLASSGVGVSASDFIRVYPETSYTHLSNLPISGGMFLAFYDSNKNLTRRISPPSEERQNYRFTPRSNEHYIRISHIGLSNNPNGVEILKFTKEIEKLWEIDFQNVTYKIIHTKQQTKGNSFYVTVRAIPLFYWDFDKSVMHENFNGSRTAFSAFSMVFSGTGYNFSLINPSPAVSWQGFGNGSTRLEMFKRLLDRYNYEFYISGKTVYLQHQIGNDTNYVYKYGLNASNVSQSTDATSMFTYIKGFGDFEDSEDYFEQAKLRLDYTSPLASILGVYEGKPIVDGRITNTETMQNAMQKAVEDSLQISVEGNLHDVRKMGYDIAVPLKGDRVWLQDDRLGLETEIRLHTITTTYDVRGEIIGCDVVFGSQSIRDRHKGQLSAVSQAINDLLEGRIELPYDILAPRAKEMLEKLMSVDSELVLDNGIFAVDPNNPNNIVGLNSAGWFISTDGGATAQTIATAEGIVANSITTGELLTHLVRIVGTDGFMWMDGNEFVAMNPLDDTQFVKISPQNGLVVSKNSLHILSGTGENAVTVWDNAEHNAKLHADTIVDDLRIGGKNLIIRKDLVDNENLSLVDGTPASVNNAVRTGYYIDVENEKYLTLTKKPGSVNKNNNAPDFSFDFTRIIYYDHNYNFISAENLNALTPPVTSDVPSNAHWARLSSSRGDLRYTKVEYGNKATDWTDSPEDIDNEMREDLRLTSPLPNEIELSRNGITAYTTTNNRYARLDYRGLFINNGAIQIRGADGRNTVINGIMQGAVLANVQRFASHLLETSDRNMVLTQPSLTEDGEWDNLYVLHDEYKGRYLDLWVVTSMLSGSPSSSGSITFRVRQLGTQNIVYSETVTVNKTDSTNIRPRLDLNSFFNSVPDYRNFSFYVEAKVNTSNNSDRIAFRLNTGWFNG